MDSVIDYTVLAESRIMVCDENSDELLDTAAAEAAVATIA
jgi:hypothetical protein